MIIDVRGPDFMGHSITWTDDDGEGFRLEIHLANRPASSPNRQRWRYALKDEQWAKGNDPEMAVVFEGDDFETSMMVTEDDAAIVRGLLGFLSLQDGDTDSEYFDNYTERQIAWRDERAETLSLYAMELEESTES